MGDEVPLDGSESSDADGDPLTYRWELVDGPVSEVTFGDASAAVTTFVPEEPGNYVLRLIVNDGREDSMDGARDVVSVSALSGEPATNVQKVAVGNTHLVLLMDDGTVRGMGCNHNGQTGVGEVVAGAVDVGAGNDHSLAIMADGSVMGWGVLGVWGLAPGDADWCGTLPCTRSPRTFEGLSNAVQVVGGLNVTYALDRDGTLWGKESGAPPAEVIRGLKFIALDSGVFDDGTLWTRDNLQLSEPLPGIVQVASNSALSLIALTDQGAVWSISSDGTAGEFTNLSNIVQIAYGNSGAIALDDQGAVWEVSTVAREPILTDVAQIAAGEGPFVAIKNDGTVWMWGKISELVTEDIANNPPEVPLQVTW